MKILILGVLSALNTASPEYTMSFMVQGQTVTIHPSTGKVDVPPGMGADVASRGFFDALRLGFGKQDCSQRDRERTR